MEEAVLVTRRWKLKTFWYEEKKRQLNRFKENKKSREVGNRAGYIVHEKNTRLCYEVEGWDLKGRHEEWEEEEEGGCLLIKVPEQKEREKQQACAREKQEEEDAGEDVSRMKENYPESRWRWRDAIVIEEQGT